MNEINEKNIIELAWRFFKRDKKELLGIDDAIAFTTNHNKIIVLNIDTFDEETDWLPGMSYFDIGWKSTIMSMSDVIVKGSKPIGCVISLGVPKPITIENLKDLYKGIKSACNYVGASFWGGDTSFTSTLHLSVVSIGLTNKLIPRSKASPNDILYTTSLYGLTSLGYNYLLKGEIYTYGIKTFLEELYRPKLVNLQFWNEIQKYVTASIDSSDGLAVSLNLLSEASNVKIIIENLPIHPIVYQNVKIEDQAIDLALYHGGEEFSFIFTVPSDKSEEILEIAKKYDCDIYRIGHIKKGIGVYLKRNEKYIKISPKGWLHGTKWEDR